jgi:hypothetical protein
MKISPQKKVISLCRNSAKETRLLKFHRALDLGINMQLEDIRAGIMSGHIKFPVGYACFFNINISIQDALFLPHRTRDDLSARGNNNGIPGVQPFFRIRIYGVSSREIIRNITCRKDNPKLTPSDNPILPPLCLGLLPG